MDSDLERVICNREVADARSRLGATLQLLLLHAQLHHEGVGDVLCPVVVGREAELAALGAALAQALDGAGQLVCLTGEPGIGKSRLVRELAGQAAPACGKPAARAG